MKQKYDVMGMTCSACSAHVDKAVRHLDGVQDVNVNLLSNCMVVDYDENKCIKDLIIRDHKNNIRFTKLTKETENKLSDNLMKMKKLIDLREEKDKDFNRDNLYKYYGVESDSQLTNKQVEEIISLLEKKEK